MASSKTPKKPIPKKSGVSPPLMPMLNALPDPVIAFDFMLKVRFTNKSAQGFFDIDEKQFLEKYMVEILGSKNTVFESIEAAVRKNQTITLHDVSVNGHPVHSVVIITIEPQKLYMFVIRRNMMHMANELSNEWNEKTKHSLKSTQMLAHEVKNPLNGIQDAAQLLLKSRNLSEEDKELARLIERETKRIQHLVDRFNIFQEVPREHYKQVNLHEVLNHVAKIAEATYGDKVRIETKFDPSLPNIRGHFDHLVQAQLNLVKNAAESLKGKKKVKISLRAFYANKAGYDPESLGRLPLCVEVEDDGSGIAPEMIRRIFQPYFTTKPQGQGLGLPIVSKIVDDHGGTIGVTSQPGKTVFRINLPLSPPEPKKP